MLMRTGYSMHIPHFKVFAIALVSLILTGVILFIKRRLTGGKD